MSLSNVSFFRSGLTIACLKSAGTCDDVRDAFIITVITGTNSAEHRFRSHVGIGSNSHDLTGTDVTNRSTSNSLTVSKQTSGTPPNATSLFIAANVMSGWSSPQSTLSSRILHPFSMKWSPNRCASRTHMRWHCCYATISHEVLCNAK